MALARACVIIDLADGSTAGHELLEGFPALSPGSLAKPRGEGVPGSARAAWSGRARRSDFDGEASVTEKGGGTLLPPASRLRPGAKRAKMGL